MAKSKRRGRRKGRTKLGGHRRERKRLLPPLAAIPNLQFVDWTEEAAPDFLWIDYLRWKLGERAYGIFHEIMDQLDGLAPAKSFDVSLTGQISRFNLLAECVTDARRVFRTMEDKVGIPLVPPYLVVFDTPLRPYVSGGGSSIDPLDDAKAAVVRILDGKGDNATLARGMWLSRMFKNGLIKIREGMFEGLERYPSQCTDDEKKGLGAEIRACFVAFAGQDERMRESSRSIWEQAFASSPCERFETVAPSPPLGSEFYRSLAEALSEIDEVLLVPWAERTITRDDFLRLEVISGLVARALGLFVDVSRLLLSGTNLNLYLRPLAETVIVISWFVRCGTDEDAKRFREFGRGQLKLHYSQFSEIDDAMLPFGLDERRLEEHLDVQSSLEMFDEYAIVDLANWTKTTMRELAIEAGVKEVYDLGFQAFSGDTHGTWGALRQTSLQMCMNPLHQGHFLPTLVSENEFPQPIRWAYWMIEKALEGWLEVPSYASSADAVNAQWVRIRELLDEYGL